MSEAINPFRIAVDDAVLDDLRSRLRNTRWPEAEVVDDWSQGTPQYVLYLLTERHAQGKRAG